MNQKIVSLQEDIETSDAEIADDLADLKEAKQELQHRRSLRAKFWKATFSARALGPDDFEDLADYFDTIDQLHARYASRLKVPSLKQVGDVLAALDSSSPEWDKHEPELFYSRYAASYSDAVKRVPAAQVASKQGCLISVTTVSPIIGALIKILLNN